jgi:uncharacterized surface protein with fasciclin (FAS1) repeats
MKKLATLGVIGALALSPSLFAMESMMSGDTMMKSDSMMKSDTMMKSDSMKMDHSMMMKMDKKSVVAIATHLGYNWKKDRAMLAKKAGINNYRGTLSQNITIKKYLLSMSMGDAGVMVGGAMMVKSRDIVDNAVLAKNVTTLVAAVKAAGLVDTLKSAGPFTVFAPTNDAFAKLPAGTVETLVKPENKATLVDILTYHVVTGSYKSSDLTDGLTLTTVEGKKLTFTKVNGKLMINGSAMVETADVISSNGVTHVIDTVLMPPKM